MNSLDEAVVRLLNISHFLRKLADKSLELAEAKKDGKDVYRMIDVLEKDLDTAKSMAYAAYILSQNNEDPI